MFDAPEERGEHLIQSNRMLVPLGRHAANDIFPQASARFAGNIVKLLTRKTEKPFGFPPFIPLGRALLVSDPGELA
jgi:hypothetical protein